MMKNVLKLGVLFLCAFSISSFVTVDAEADKEQIKWYTWEEAIEANKQNPKKMFIDVFTSWCGYCKKMDKTTFKNPKIAKYLNDNFYPVKFNAEQKEIIEFQGHQLKFMKSGRRGVHELAYALLDGRLGYPSFVYLDENQARITISPGYKTTKVLLDELSFVAGEHYKNGTYEDYLKGNSKP